MRRHLRTRQGQPGKACFDPDPRHEGRQRDCSQPPCRQASTAASQRRWLSTPDNHEDVCGPVNVHRVQPWRKHPPGDWRRTRAPPLEA
jgi:hypothetical protein